jgi:hypothetical protein
VVHTCDPSIWEDEAGGSQVQTQNYEAISCLKKEKKIVANNYI